MVKSLTLLTLLLAWWVKIMEMLQSMMPITREKFMSWSKRKKKKKPTLILSTLHHDHYIPMFIKFIEENPLILKTSSLNTMKTHYRIQFTGIVTRHRQNTRACPNYKGHTTIAICRALSTTKVWTIRSSITSPKKKRYRQSFELYSVKCLFYTNFIEDGVICF